MDRLIKNTTALTDHGNTAARQLLIRVTEQTLTAVHPTNQLPDHLARHQNTLRVNDHAYQLDEIDDVYLLAAGKGANALAAATIDYLGEHLTEGVVVDKHGQTINIPGLEAPQRAIPFLTPMASGGRQGSRARTTSR